MSTALRTYCRGENLVSVDDHKSGKSYVYHFDGQGTVQCLTDETGAVTDRFAADALGNPVKRTGTSINKHWYIGKSGYYGDRDPLYVRARHYQAATSRWMSVDPLAGLGWPVEHRYKYGENSPVRYVDPSGLIPAPCKPEHVRCTCLGKQSFASCGSQRLGPGHHYSPNDCYAAACAYYCQRRDAIFNLIYVCVFPQSWGYNWNHPKQVTPTLDKTTCPGCFVGYPENFWEYLNAGKQDLPGWFFLPCPADCQTRVCCFEQTPQNRDNEAGLKNRLKDCYEQVMRFRDLDEESDRFCKSSIEELRNQVRTIQEMERTQPGMWTDLLRDRMRQLQEEIARCQRGRH